MRTSISSRVWRISQTTRTCSFVFFAITAAVDCSTLLQQYEQLLEDMVGPGEARAIQMDRTRMEKALTGDRIFSIPCELGVRYPSLRAMMNLEDLHLHVSVRFRLNKYTFQ